MAWTDREETKEMSLTHCVYDKIIKLQFPFCILGGGGL